MAWLGILGTKLLFCKISFCFFNFKKLCQTLRIGWTVFIHTLVEQKESVCPRAFSLSQILPSSLAFLHFHCSDSNHGNKSTPNPLNVCSSGSKNSCQFWEYWYRIISSCRQLCITHQKRVRLEIMRPYQTDWIISKGVFLVLSYASLSFSMILFFKRAYLK